MFHRFLSIFAIFQLINSQCDKWMEDGSDYSDVPTPDPNDIVDTKEDLPWEEQASIATRFINHRLVPELIELPPRFKCHAWFPGLLSSVRVITGGELKRHDLFEPPVNMSWRYIRRKFYTVFLSTPDYTTTTNFTNWRQLHHWLIVNVVNCDINSGDTVLDYLIPRVVKKSGYTRYAFLVYLQPEKIPAPKLKRNGLNATFTIKQYVEKHKLGNPKFGNYFFIYYE